MGKGDLARVGKLYGQHRKTITRLWKTYNSKHKDGAAWSILPCTTPVRASRGRKGIDLVEPVRVALAQIHIKKSRTTHNSRGCGSAYLDSGNRHCCCCCWTTSRTSACVLPRGISSRCSLRRQQASEGGVGVEVGPQQSWWCAFKAHHYYSKTTSTSTVLHHHHLSVCKNGQQVKLSVLPRRGGGGAADTQGSTQQQAAYYPLLNCVEPRDFFFLSPPMIP